MVAGKSVDSGLNPASRTVMLCAAAGDGFKPPPRPGSAREHEYANSGGEDRRTPREESCAAG